MKKMTIIAAVAIALTAFAPEAQAQGFLKGLADKAKEKVKEKITDKVDRSVEKAADNILDGKKGKKSKNNEEADYQPSNRKTSKDDDTPAGEAGYQKSDFVAGAEAFFFDEVKGEKVGEFPSRWDLVSGEEVEIATYNKQNVIKLGGWYTEIMPLMKQKDYLPEEFTLEYEILTTGVNEGSNNDHLDVVFFSEDQEKIMVFTLNPDGDSDPGLEFLKPDESKGRSTAKGSTISSLVKKNTWTKVELSFNKRALKIYVNGSRIFNIPNMMQPLRMKLRSVSNSDERPYFFIKNIRLAKGAVELYGKNESDVDRAMAETGKFVTNNINFETGKATLLPESMEEIKKVADYMLKNKSVRFEVQGHCDNQGSDKVNDPLSQSRAEAVVAALVKLGVDEWNLRAVGKGSHEPIADNKTKEGQAKNRRVEFIKK